VPPFQGESDLRTANIKLKFAEKEWTSISVAGKMFWKVSLFALLFFSACYCYVCTVFILGQVFIYLLKFYLSIACYPSMLSWPKSDITSQVQGCHMHGVH